MAVSTIKILNYYKIDYPYKNLLRYQITSGTQESPRGGEAKLLLLSLIEF